ncbi:hypothetical protein HGM15179_002710 [Zosterops borbonicus]|uniref:Uncharacterized protein n=1 Tax=Zosterops borbonicus TaxID=364589 RepID=A0A8K1GUF4_9PASS|nr:hypothetical protein HGM15179_002710 [Zosterops borbonicus]
MEAASAPRPRRQRRDTSKGCGKASPVFGDDSSNVVSLGNGSEDKAEAKEDFREENRAEESPTTPKWFQEGM